MKATCVARDADLNQYRPLLTRYLRKHWKETHGVEDLIQETFLRALERFHTLRNPESLDGWLLRIAHNVAMDRHRGKQRRERAEAPLRAAREPVQAPADFEAETRFVGHCWQQSVRHAVSTLTRRDRSLIIAHYFVGLSCRVIAERSGLSVANVKVRLHRARRIMRRRLPATQEFRDWLQLRAAYSERGLGPQRPVRRRNGGAGLAV